jgi:NADH dehydrogenase/NADH:ubiquinone oxidoreductase subunit G
MSTLTVEQFQRALPAQVKKSVNQELIDQVNKTISDPEVREAYRDNLLGYAHVMKDGKFKIQSYLDAVRYVSFKLMGGTNIDCYIKTFPDKYQRFLAQGVANKDIASYVTAYNKSKLVNLIYAQTLTPSYVLNQDLYQKALNVQADLMMTASSEKVRTDAANSLLSHLKMPETQKVELDIGVKEDKTIQALKESTMALVAQQRQMLQTGAMHAQEVAHSKLIIEGTATEVHDA